jgi:peptidoglycan/LPS O-acetylase OafA/YrhL
MQMGAWIAEAYATGALRAIPRLLANAFLATLFVIAYVCIVILGRFDRTTLDVPATLGFAVLVAALLRAEEDSPHALSGGARFARWLGVRSYSFYLCHYTVIASSIELYARLRKVPDKNAWGGSPELLFATFFGLVAALFTADLLYRFVEAPSHRLARTLASRKKAGAPSCDAPA